MILAPINLISTDERDVAFISGTRMKVRQIVIEKNAWGLTPEQIQNGHGYLSLAQIYAALSYYYEHKTVIDREIEASKRETDRLRAESTNPLTRETLEQRYNGR